MGKVAFVFPGQASQYPGMGKELAEKYPSARAVFDVLLDSARRCGAAVLIVTHDPQLSARCDRILRLSDGRLQPEQASH